VNSWSYNPSASYNPGKRKQGHVDLNNTLVVRKTTTRVSWFGTALPVSDHVGSNTTKGLREAV